MTSRLLKHGSILMVLLGTALFLTACLHAAQETTCKVKFKKKYDCPFRHITVVENMPVLGDQLILKGCGKTVTYNGTTEILVED
jgi:hypothetical protein